MIRLPDDVRAVFFDAVGTLLHPEPGAAQAYHAIGSRHGSRLDLAEVTRRFAAAFRAEEQVDATHGHRTDEAREIARWRRIVAVVLDDVSDVETCFRELYDHFARPDAWRLEPGAAEVLSELRAAGFVVGVATNFDHRLRGLVGGLPTPEHLAISSEVGWKKPAREFFAALTAMTGLPPEKLLLVGDDPDNDVRGAKEAGLQALLFDPRKGSLAGLLGHA